MELSIRVHVMSEGQPETVLMSHDWGNKSVFLRTHHPLPLGAPARISVVIPRQPTPVVMDAVVARVVTAEHNAPTLPPGMALHFGTMPPLLRSHLAGLHEHTAIRTIIGAKIMPPVLVIASTTSDRLTAAHALESAGYDVTEANTVSSVQNALTLGPKYEAAVFIGDIKRGDVVNLVQGLSTYSADAITIEEPANTLPTALTESLNCPLIVLPPNASVDTIREAVALHVAPRNVKLEETDGTPLDPAMIVH
jgi:CheY-like chemotaxis protein